MIDAESEYPYDDDDNTAWEARFGRPYVDDDYTGKELDEAALQRMEREFHGADGGARTPFGDLEQLDDGETPHD
tara:strand:- start:944 stop:1165 length:222 start_codon:yes stop_codon:yes gene_type:complete